MKLSKKMFNFDKNENHLYLISEKLSSFCIMFKFPTSTALKKISFSQSLIPHLRVK